MSILDKLQDKAKTLGKRVVYPEGEEERTIVAAKEVIEKGIAKVTLVGNPQRICDLAKQHGITLAISEMPPGLVAGINPSLMRQVFVSAVSYFLEQMTVSQITFGAKHSGESAVITVSGRPAGKSASDKSQLMREIIVSQGGSVGIRTDDDTLSFVFSLPSPARTPP